jgi:ATP-dependent DNA ligase
MGIMLRMRALPAGFIAPYLPTKTDKLPSGDLWLYEIKHDGFRVTSSAFYRLALACGEARPS